MRRPPRPSVFGLGPPTAHSGPVITSRLPALAVLGAAALAVAYVGAVDPNEAGHYPPCPLLEYAGVLCPGCGGLRSVHALTRAEVGVALGANVMVVLLAVTALWCWLLWFATPLRSWSLPRVTPWAWGGLFLVFTVARNLPWGAALAP